MTPRKIYIASSWKNVDRVRMLAELLRSKGHQVFDFTDINNRPEGTESFVFHASEWMGKPLKKIDWIEFLKCDATARACKADKSGLDWSDTLILLLPSGRSAHIEAGYAKASGKTVLVYGDLPLGEFDAMYLLFDGWHKSIEIFDLLERLEAPI